MKYSKTTLRELSAKYRSILKKCFLLNAMAMGLIVATNASAALTAADMNDIATSINTGYVAAPVLGDYLYDKDGDGTVDTVIDGSTVTVNNAWYEFDLSDGSSGNAGSTITTADARYTFTAQDDTATSYNAGSASIDATKYSWTPTGGSATALSDADIGATELSKTGYTYTDWNGATQNISDGAPNPSAYAFTNSSGDPDSLANYFDTAGKLVLPPEEIEYASTAMSHYDTDNTNYENKYSIWETDEGNYLTATGKLDSDIGQLATNKQNYQDDSDALTAAQGLRDTAQASLTAVNGAYNTAKAASDAYDDSLGKAVDTKADSAINRAVADGGAVKTAIDNAVAYDNTTSGLTATTMQDAIDENASAIAENTDAITTLNGDANTDGSVAKALADAKAYTDTLENGAVASNTSAIATNTSDIATLNGDEETSGSVAYAVKQLADGAVATNTSAISTLNGDENTSGSVAYAVKQLADGAVASNTSAIATNTSAIATLNGDENTDGSVAKAVADEAAARNTAIAAATTMGATDGKNYTAGSSVIAAIESIDTNMGKIHGLIGSDGSFNGTATSTNMDGTTYKGNLAVGTTVEDHLVALDNTIGIMSNLTTIEKTTVVGAINEVDAKIGTTADGTYVAAANTVGQNLNALDSALGDVRSDMASTQAANNARFAQIDRRIDKLEDKMEKGLAANNALAGLVPLDHTHKTQLSAALGGYGSNQALAVGAFHYINDSTLLNAGVGYGGNSSLSYKVGVTFGF